MGWLFLLLQRAMFLGSRSRSSCPALPPQHASSLSLDIPPLTFTRRPWSSVLYSMTVFIPFSSKSPSIRWLSSPGRVSRNERGGMENWSAYDLADKKTASHRALCSLDAGSYSQLQLCYAAPVLYSKSWSIVSG